MYLLNHFKLYTKIINKMAKHLLLSYKEITDHDYGIMKEKALHTEEERKPGENPGLHSNFFSEKHRGWWLFGWWLLSACSDTCSILKMGTQSQLATNKGRNESLDSR